MPPTGLASLTTTVAGPLAFVLPPPGLITTIATMTTTTARPRNTSRWARLMRVESLGDGEHAPFAHVAVQRHRDRAELGEAHARAGHEVVDRRGGQHLARPGGGGQAGGDLQRGAAQPAAGQLALAGVHAGGPGAGLLQR